MAFEKATNQNKNQFVTSLVSRKSDRATCWLNMTDGFIKATFGVKSTSDITAKQVEERLGEYYNNSNVYLKVTDLTAELPSISPEDF